MHNNSLNSYFHHFNRCIKFIQILYFCYNNYRNDSLNSEKFISADCVECRNKKRWCFRRSSAVGLVFASSSGPDSGFPTTIINLVPWISSSKMICHSRCDKILDSRICHGAWFTVMIQNDIRFKFSLWNEYSHKIDWLLVTDHTVSRRTTISRYILAPICEFSVAFGNHFAAQ